MDTEQLAGMFATPERIEILYYILSKGRGRVREISRTLSMSPGLVSKYLNYLCSIGVLTRKGNVFEVAKGEIVEATWLLLYKVFSYREGS